MTVDDIMRFLQPLKIKMQLMVGRAVLLAVDNTGKSQRLRLQFTKDELVNSVERVQEYGFDTNPPVADSSEVAYMSIGGNRGLTYVIATQVREFRPNPPLADGEVQVYTKFGNKVYLKADGSVVVTESGGAVLTMAGGVFTLLGSVNLKATGGDPVMLEPIIDKFNQHTHLYTPGAGAPVACGPPAVPWVAGVDSAADVKAKV